MVHSVSTRDTLLLVWKMPLKTLGTRKHKRSFTVKRIQMTHDISVFGIT